MEVKGPKSYAPPLALKALLEPVHHQGFWQPGLEAARLQQQAGLAKDKVSVRVGSRVGVTQTSGVPYIIFARSKQSKRPKVLSPLRGLLEPAQQQLRLQ